MASFNDIPFPNGAGHMGGSGDQVLLGGRGRLVFGQTIDLVVKKNKHTINFFAMDQVIATDTQGIAG